MSEGKLNTNQTEVTSASPPSTKDFDVIFASKTDDGTIITTSAESFTQRQLSIALSVYDPKNDNYSVYLNEGVSQTFEQTEVKQDEKKNDSYFGAVDVRMFLLKHGSLWSENRLHCWYCSADGT